MLKGDRKFIVILFIDRNERLKRTSSIVSLIKMFLSFISCLWPMGLRRFYCSIDHMFYVYYYKSCNKEISSQSLVGLNHSGLFLISGIFSNKHLKRWNAVSQSSFPFNSLHSGVYSANFVAEEVWKDTIKNNKLIIDYLSYVRNLS